MQPTGTADLFHYIWASILGRRDSIKKPDAVPAADQVVMLENITKKRWKIDKISLIALTMKKTSFSISGCIKYERPTTS